MENAVAERLQRQAAGALADAGLGPGDRVAVALPNSPELLVLVLGALRTGVVPVPLHAALLPHEVDGLVDDADPALVVRDQAHLEELVAGGREIDLAPVPLARPMHYTSGTSGRPKGVWSGILTEDEAHALFADEADLWGFSDADCHLTCSPLSHSVAVRFSASCLLRGGSLVLLERFDSETVVRALGELPITTVFMVPAHIERLLGRGEVPMTGVRRLVHAGAPCPESLKRRMLDAFPAGSVWEFYGSTEGQFTVCGPEEWRARPGTVGRARPGRRLELDADGQIWCHSPPFTRFQYWGDQEKTRSAWRGDAFTVGDLGRLDGEGYLFLRGRRDDLIITGGINVYPLEVEQVLAALPGIQEVAVFGVRDPRWGERVCAAVVGDINPRAVTRWARERLAGFKCPKDVHVIHRLPRTGTGKVRRADLAAALGLERPPAGGANG